MKLGGGPLETTFDAVVLCLIGVGVGLGGLTDCGLRPAHYSNYIFSITILNNIIIFYLHCILMYIIVICHD